MAVAKKRVLHLGLILALVIIVSILHYAEQLGMPVTLPPSSHFGLTRHALDRILFLLPIIYASSVFGLAGGLAMCGISLTVMLPRAFLLSPAPWDALLETMAATVAGVLVSIVLWRRARERDQYWLALSKLEQAHKLLQRYVQQARSEERRLTTLNNISTVLAESLELDKILEKAINLIMDIMEVEVGLIFTLEEKTQELVLMAYEGVSEKFAQEVNRRKIGEGFNGRVAKTGEPLIIKDVTIDTATEASSLKEMKIETEMIVPMTFKGRIVGTIWVAQRRPRDFLPGDVDLLTAIGSQMANAIVNARLYEEHQRIIQRLSIAGTTYRELFENASDAMWVHDLEGNIIAANKAAEELTGYSGEELLAMRITKLLAEESLNLAWQIRRKLFEGEPIRQPYELRVIKRDGTKTILQLTTHLVTAQGKIIGFQYIAREVTEERKTKTTALSP